MFRRNHVSGVLGLSALIAIGFGQRCHSQVIIPKAATAGWREMAKAVETVQISSQYRDPTERVRQITDLFLQKGLQKCELSREEERGKKTSELVEIRNRHGFSLSTKGDNKWYLTRIYKPGDFMPKLRNATCCATAGFDVHGSATLLEVNGNPDLNVLYWRDADDESGEVEMRVHDNVLKTTATLRLQPTKRFRVVSTVYTDEEDDEEVKYICEYKDDSLLTEVVPSRRYSTHKKVRGSSELLSISDRKLPVSEFSITHYGLPEYVEPGVSKWWIWLGLATIVGLVFIVIQLRGKW
jgi:hypothetical protein